VSREPGQLFSRLADHRFSLCPVTYLDTKIKHEAPCSNQIASDQSSKIAEKAVLT